MKKILSLLAALSVVSSGFALDQKIISIDSLSIMQKSQEGLFVAKEIQNKIEKFQTKVKKAQKELVDFQETINKQSKVLSKEALAEKTEKLEQKKKDLERDLSGQEEKLRGEIQKKQFILREKQLAVVNKMFEREKWDMVVDKNTPGVLCVSNALDQTSSVLKAIDDEYLAEKGKKSETKASPTKAKQQVKVA